MLKTITIAENISNTRWTKLAHMLSGVILLFLTAQISIPLQPVPITLQTFGVILLGLTFERKLAIQSIISYLVIGALGAPVFAFLSGGHGVFLGPTGGYLFGFLAAIILMTTLRKPLKQTSVFSVFLIGLLGSAAIYSCGVFWLYRFMNFDQAVKVGLLPFIVPGMIKIALLALTIKHFKAPFFSRTTSE